VREKSVRRAVVADWSLSREDLSGRDREGFKPPQLERAQGKLAGLRQLLRRFADLQFGSVWRDLAALLPEVRGTLADVGCGAQPFRDLLSPDVQYIGVDIAGAEEQFGYRVSDIRQIRGANLPLADGEVNTVLCTETLEHVREPRPFLREIARALAPQGRLILTVPFAARWHFIPHDYWRYTPSGLSYLLAEAGFCEVRIYARGGALAVAAYKVLGLVLLMLAGHGCRGLAAVPWRALGVCLTPLAAVAMLAGNLGIRYPGPAEDTLGYTVLACRQAPR
jgi:SAM-dependent methyltransferase